MGDPTSAQRRYVRATVRPFALHLLAIDLPGLQGARRDSVIEFVEHRVATMPSITRFGVFVIAGCMRAVCTPTVVGWFGAHPLPLIGEYARLVRSLAVTYTWETWPSTLPDGSEGAGRVQTGATT